MPASASTIETVTQRILDRELRDPHSDAYQRGLRQGVALRLTGSSIVNGFTPGSAEHDAFEAGARRGLDCTGSYMHQYAHETNTIAQLYPDPKRLADRLARGRALAQRIIRDMQNRGMGEALLIGSMSTGKIHEHSDIDILVIDCGTLKPFFVVGEIVDTSCRAPGDEDLQIDCVVIALLAEDQRPKWLALRNTADAR